jgi:hypothetical protein
VLEEKADWTLVLVESCEAREEFPLAGMRT